MAQKNSATMERLDALGEKLQSTGNFAKIRLIELQLENGRKERTYDRKETIRRELELSKAQARTKKDRERIQRALDRLNGEPSAICRKALI